MRRINRRSRLQQPNAATEKIRGQPRPTRRRSDPVKFAVMKWIFWDQAMTASTANSGRAWSHARIARAIPCDTRNWAHSAAQEIMNAEKTTAGNGQAFTQKPPGPAGAAPGTIAARIAAARR